MERDVGLTQTLPGGGASFLSHKPTPIAARSHTQNRPRTLADCTPRAKGCCPHFLGQETKAATPTEGPAHHPYLICFQLLMSKDCLLVAHGEDHCQDSGTSSQSPQTPRGHTGRQAAAYQCLGKSPCPGCHLPTLLITPSLSETQVTAELSGQQPEYVHGHQSKEKGFGRSQGSPQWGEHTCHHQVRPGVWGTFERWAGWCRGCQHTPGQIPAPYPLVVWPSASHLASLSLLCKMEIILVLPHRVVLKI